MATLVDSPCPVEANTPAPGDAEISFFPSCKSTTPAKPAPDIPATIGELVGFIRSNNRDEVEACRATLREKGRDAYKAAKAKLPAVTLSGAMTTRKGGVSWEARGFRHSGFLQIDLDLADHRDWITDEIVEQLAKFPFVYAAFESVDGEGVKAIARVPVAADEREHRAAWRAVAAELAKVGLTMDPATIDPFRLCYVSHDPGAYQNAMAVSIEVLAEHYETATGGSGDDGVNANDLTRLPLPDIDEDAIRLYLAELGPDMSYDQWLRVGQAIHHQTGGSSDGLDLWDEWSSGGSKYEAEGANSTTAKWRSFKSRNRENPLTFRSVLGMIEPERAAGVQRKLKRDRSLAANTALRAEPVAESLGVRTGAKPVPELLRDLPLTDAGNAERVHALHGENIRWVPEWGKWLIWTGTRWVPDPDEQIRRWCVETMRMTSKQAAAIQEAGLSRAKFDFARRSENTGPVSSMLEMLKAVPGVTISATALDADPWLVGTPGGVVDLRAGKPIEPDRGQLITKSIGADYVEGADAPLWREFLHTVTGGDKELERFLQTAVGYSLTGTCNEQCLFFLYGTGQNGKGVFSETLKALVGDYGQTAPESLFTRDRNSSATNDVARLAGARLAIAAELDEGSAFAESRLKALTGGDTITARFLHREFFDFTPTHKFWISGNHKPTVRGTDMGIWRRIRLIPFTVRIPEEKKDRKLAEKLRGEMPGILNWALEGCALWQRKGLVTPECVKAATEDYRKEEDVVGQFLEDSTDATDPDARVTTTDVFQAYERWAGAEGIQPRFRLTARRLIRRIEEHGFRRVKSSGARYWQGLAITNGNPAEIQGEPI